MMTLRLSGEGHHFTRSGFCDMDAPPPPADLPAILVSYWYVKGWLRYQPRINYRSWALDSGAFSAYNSGKKIDIDQYVEFCKEKQASDSTLHEIFALDVVKDWRAGLRNVERMWGEGIPAIPTYHIGEPEHVLEHLAKNYPKIALGGVKALRGKAKREWPIACFRRIWPCRVHGFAVTGVKDILAVPWDSVDSTTWFFGPQTYGMWRAYGGRMCVLGGVKKKSYAPEVRTYLELERKCRARWRRKYSELEQLTKEAS